MREIKFRAIREEYNPAWHQSIFRFGNLLNSNSIGEVGCDLSHYEYAKVKPETIGQFTGLKDKNGVDIYEGDIYQSNDYDLYQVLFVNSCFVGGKTKESCVPLVWGYDCELEKIVFDNFNSHIEIIGNIYENPELLKP